jgi:hypothetical protein
MGIMSNGGKVEKNGRKEIPIKAEKLELHTNKARSAGETSVAGGNQIPKGCGNPRWNNPPQPLPTRNQNQ